MTKNEKKDMLIEDIKNSANHVNAHSQVIENLEYNMIESEERNNAIKTVEYIKGSKYESDLNIHIKEYIYDYILKEIFEKIVDDLDLPTGDIYPSSVNKITEGLFEYIKNNI